MTTNREQSIQRLIQNIHITTRTLGSGPTPTCAKNALTKQQSEILFLLSQEPSGLSVKELADRLRVTSGAITQFIDVLVEKKLVSRKEDSADRRVLRLILTSKARNNFKDFEDEYFRNVAGFFGRLTDTEIETLSSILEKTNPRQQKLSIDESSRGGEVN